MSNFCFTSKQLNNLKKLKKPLVGQKAYNLIQLKSNKQFSQQIPDFGLITSTLYSEIISTLAQEVPTIDKITTLKPSILLKKIEKVLTNLKIKECIQKIARTLSSSITQGIAIRPSATFMTNGHDSILSGLFPTYLNVKSVEEVYLAIKQIIKISFSSEIVDYLHLNHQTLRNLSISFLIQKMIIPETSGIAYPFNPITQNNNQMIIEAVFGLGHALANGEIIPDTYVINKSANTILEKRISPQAWMYIPKTSTHTIQQVQKINLSDMLKYAQKLDDQLLLQIGQLINTINENSDQPLLLEWATVGNTVYILQAKQLDITLPKNNSSKSALNRSLQNTPLLQGISITTGESVGTVYKANIHTGLENLPKQDFIIVAPTLSRNIVIKLAKNKYCKGFVFDLVAPDSDIAEIVKRYQIPTISQTYNGTKMLKNNQIVKINAAKGLIFLLKDTTISRKEDPTHATKKNQTTKTINTVTNILTIYTRYDNGIYVDSYNSQFLYIIPLAKTTSIKQLLKQHPNAHHILVKGKTVPMNLTKQYLKLNRSKDFKQGFIIDDFIDIPEIISSLKLTKTYYVLLNLQRLYETTYKKSSKWYSDKNFIKFITPLVKQFSQYQYVKLLNMQSQKNKITTKLSNALITLGFIGTIKDY